MKPNAVTSFYVLKGFECESADFRQCDSLFIFKIKVIILNLKGGFLLYYFSCLNIDEPLLINV